MTTHGFRIPVMQTAMVLPRLLSVRAIGFLHFIGLLSFALCRCPAPYETAKRHLSLYDQRASCSYRHFVFAIIQPGESAFMTLTGSIQFQTWNCPLLKPHAVAGLPRQAWQLRSSRKLPSALLLRRLRMDSFSFSTVN